jgi:TonB-dependent SusC/RagA subfamily outer membrane receptor
MKKHLLFPTLTLCLTYGAFAQSSSHEINIVNRLKDYLSTSDPEKAYLQFDRPYYVAGDTVFFKAYVTKGGRHKLSDLSGVLHVDLINTENKINQSLLLRLENGVCWGDFALPDSLPTGNYRIRAYTQWMLNSGEFDFFDQNIPVAALPNHNVSDSLNNQPPHSIKNKADVQFFPEGGTLIEGIETKLAFKAIGTNGLGIKAKGVILDKADKPVCSFESSHLGMGYFLLNPEKGNAYKAKVSFADGTQSIVDLPGQVAYGISLSLTTESTSAIGIVITANDTFYRANRNKDFLLVFYSGGKAISYSSKQESHTITLDMDRKVFQTGVSTITLFSPEGEPLCERLLFVQHNDLLGLQIHADKATYRKREKVNLSLNAKSPTGFYTNGHFSMTITDEGKMPINENYERNIVTNLLLTSDLKGYVEQPDYYFTDTSENARKDLDLLMLTQGYRNFEWKQVFSNVPAITTFQPEKGLDISGKITNGSNNPVPDRAVTLIPSKGGPLVSSKSDSIGVFHFPNLVFTDSTHLVINVVNAKGDNATRITYIPTNRESPTVLPYPLQGAEDSGMLAYLEKARRGHHEYRDGGPAKLLKPAMVKGQMPDTKYRTQSLAGAGFADQVMHADEIEKAGGLLSKSLNGRLNGVSFINGVPYLTSTIQNSNAATIGSGPMLIVLDGSELKDGSHYSLDNIPSTQVQTVEVLKNASTSIYGLDGANGVLIITTKNGYEESKTMTAVGVLPITVPGFYKAKTFYSPKYDVAMGTSTAPKLRSTIYWNPEITTDKDGNAILDYYNAEDTGTYKIIVEGIDTNGNIGRLVYRYTVD